MRSVAIGGVCGALLAAGSLSLAGRSPGVGLILAALWLFVLVLLPARTGQP